MAFESKDNTIYTRVFTTWLAEDGICRTIVKKNAEIELEDAKENSMAVSMLVDGNPLPLLVDLREIKSISKPARDHFAMRNRKPGVTAIAMLVRSPLSKVVGNFFLGINVPTVPTKLFTSEILALKWLHENFVR